MLSARPGSPVGAVPLRVAVGIAIVVVAGGGRLAIPAAADSLTPVADPQPVSAAPSPVETPPALQPFTAKPTPSVKPSATRTAASRSVARTPVTKPRAKKPAPVPTATRKAPVRSATPPRRTTPTPSSAGASSVRSGDPRSIARSMLAARGWSSQFSCLDSLWTKESGWRTTAANPSGAYGIPQALPGSKMASAGSDWRTNAATQIEWGLGYIAERHGSPCGAWSHSKSKGWY